MHLNPFYPKRSLLILTACLLLPALTARGDEPTLRELLRDGLYTEEVTRDPEAAAKQYEQLLARYSEQRDFAAAALFRLAEVRRKQDRKEDAVKLYQRLLTEFPGAANETKLARENLTALGGKAEPGQTPIDEEFKELARLELLAKTSPDIILDPETLVHASSEGWSKVVEYLLTAGARPYAGGPREDALSAAVGEGNLTIIKQLIGSKVAVPDEIGHAAIVEAVNSDREAILEFLLQEHIKPGNMIDGVYDGASVFCMALLEGKQSSAEILLKYGADLNAMSDVDAAVRSGNPCGTPLHLAIHYGKLEAANWLLEKGAKPDAPDDRFGLTPLHYAANSTTKGCLELMARLLTAGADPNRTSSAKMPRDDRREPSFVGATPLMTAFASKFNPIEKMRLLLKHGADPNVMGIEGGNFEEGPLLRVAVTEGNTELVKMLLDAGADLKFHDIGKNIIWNAANVDDEDRSVECLKLLVAAGAKPQEGSWPWSNFANVKPGAMRYLTEQFSIPGLVGGTDITLVVDPAGGANLVKLASKQDGGKVPDLATWLLANHQKIQWAIWVNGPAKFRWFLWRRDGNGVLAKQELNPQGSEALPALQWGDVVSCQGNGRPNENNMKQSLPPEIIWPFRKRVVVPVTVEIEGKTREITLRGDRLVFDPTKDEMPVVSAQELVDFLIQPGGYQPTQRGMIIDNNLVGKGLAPDPLVISRTGWPDVRLESGSMAAKKFQLQSGDRLKLEVSEDYRKELQEYRKRNVTIQVTGLPYIRDLPGSWHGGKSALRLPSLIQALVETQVPSRVAWREQKGETINLENSVFLEYAFNGFTLLPHPDLAHIRIRRLLEDGKETVIDVDLQKAISASSAETTTDEARKADVMLQTGDVVEISPKKADLDLPWKGFTAEQERFFAKALSGRVQATDGEGNVSVKDIDYQAPRFVELDNRWIPVLAKGGVPSARGEWVLGYPDGRVKRGELEEREVSSVFLRDGDEYRGGSGGGNLRPPMPRVVPPPASSRQ